MGMWAARTPGHRIRRAAGAASLAAVTALAGGTTLAGGTALAADTGPATAAAAPARPGALTARYTSIPFDGDSAAVDAQVATGSTIPLWRSTVQSGTTTFSYSMVGANPFVAHTNATRTVTTQIVPIAIDFGGGVVMDPTAADPTCSPAGTPLALTQASPIFGTAPYTVGGTALGTGQYEDVFQRANFFTETKPGGVGSNNHLKLALATQPVFRATATSFPTQAAPCGRLGLIDVSTFDSFLKSNVFPTLTAAGVGPTAFPVFLLHDVVLYQGTTANCCILGYHSAFKNASFANGFQTYAVADYDTTNDFSGTADISALSHEVGEWIDDPGANNATPPWGHIGQVSGCQSNLEDGDPLSGTTFPVTMPNGFTYHPQELAFFSWFYRQTPSLGVNGYYSFRGTFRSAAPPCA